MKYFFDQFALDTAVRELSGYGEAVKVEPKVYDLLLHLVENRDRVVSKDELVTAVWDGRFISEATLSSAVRSARKALGDDGKNQRFVRTLHGHGFRFVAPVVETRAERPPAPGTRADELPIQDIRFCHSADGTRIAYALAGAGGSSGQGRQLAEPSGIRLGEPGMEAFLQGAGE